MDVGAALTYGAIFLALSLYALTLALRCTTRRRLALARAAWTGGFAAYVLQVVAAFVYFHDGSHDAAYRATAARTAELTGWS